MSALTMRHYHRAYKHHNSSGIVIDHLNVDQLTGLELIKKGLLDLARLLPVCVLAGRLLAHLAVQHSLHRDCQNGTNLPLGITSFEN